ncbi:MAG: glycosyltransferase [Erysipelotrichales bacterium]|nr:glycosyltransferase [Erysipelotrichales bacterium]
MKTKILYFVDKLCHDGIQTLLLNIVKNIDTTKFSISFLCFDFGKEYELEKVIKELGCEIYKVAHPQKKPFKCLKQLNLFFKLHKFDIVHCHSSSKSAIVLRYAKKHRVKIRIAHSHCTHFQTKNIFIKMIGNFLMIYTRKYATHYAACSLAAAEWMFGKKNIDSGKVKIIRNAIDISTFSYNDNVRNELRTLYNISDKTFVIGHIGRFMDQKNHKFMIEVLNQLRLKCVDCKMVFVGVGDLMQECQELCHKLNLDDYVIFAGYQSRAYQFYSMFDVFILPSLFEGLPFVGVEAQASGLKCLFSLTVSKQVALCDKLCSFIDLSYGEEHFATCIIDASKEKINRYEIYDELKNSGYDIKSEIKNLESYYMGLLD